MESTIDFERYDRQNRTYGKEATTSLSNSTIIIKGLAGGLATESTKNLLLSGVQNIILIEDGNIETSDLSTGFYYNENDIGKPRHQVLSIKLAELNPYCNISHCTEDNCDFSKKVILFHNGKKDEANELNKLARINNSKFIWVRSKGVSGTLFVDCLDEHIVTDSTGEIIEPVQLEKVTNDGKVYCAQHNIHEFQNDDTIKFSNLTGDNLDFLSKQEWKIKVINRTCFQLQHFNMPESEFNLINGTAVFIKKPITIKHNSLDKELDEPTIVGFNQDFDKGVIDIYNKELDLPNDSWSEEMNNIVSTVENKELGKLIRSSNLELMPVVSVLGSLAAMEVIKAVTNKFMPVLQWMVYSDSTIVPDKEPFETSHSGIGNLLGTNCQKNLESKNWLMVGCGAIGCEMLKNFAKINLATSGGKLHVTDPDHIEQSNLSRQFLFRNSHIGKSKSKTAANVIHNMNSNISIDAMLDKMSDDNQKIIDDMAPELFGVINALDNIEARRYMDEQCFRYGKPLFESGTQGMKGNTQPVIPFVTETYSNSSDPPQEKSFPVCTIKNFPNQPHHTIHWAMDYFEQFQRGPNNVNGYLTKGKEFIESLSGYDKSVATEDIHKYMVKYKPESWRGCAKWASDMFLELYRDQIIQLLHNFPKDSLTSSGELFWSKGKRCPDVVNYDLTNSLVVDFLEATTHLFARTLGLDDIFTRDQLIAELVSYQPYNFEVDVNKKIASNDTELEKESQTEKEYELPAQELGTGMYLVPQNFEKDDDSNWHVSFVTAASNLRSTNYGIPTSSFDEAKGIAGRIVPAVATTTSIVAGLITMELLKYCSFVDNSCEQDKIIENYKSWFVSLANNILVASEPIPAPMLKFGETEINSWTKFELNEDVSLNRFIQFYEEKFKTKISMVLHGTSIMYANFMPCTIGDSLLSKIFKDKYDIDLFSSNAEIVISSEDENIELPTIQIKMKKKVYLETN